MKLPIFIIPTLLAAASSAEYLEQNTLCGDNLDCQNNCQDGRYHIVTDNSNSIHFGCSLTPAAVPVTYANPDCSFGLEDGEEETANARATCDTVGGTLCRRTFHNLGRTFINYCVMLGKDVGAYEGSCEAAGGKITGHNTDMSYEILADKCE